MYKRDPHENPGIVKSYLEQSGINVREYGVVSSDAALFASCHLTLDSSWSNLLENGATVAEKSNNDLIWIDPNSCCYAIYSKLNPDKVHAQQSPLALAKALKRPIRKGIVGPTLMVEELGLRKLNDGFACATAGEVQKWMEAFYHAKQQVQRHFCGSPQAWAVMGESQQVGRLTILLIYKAEEEDWFILKNVPAHPHKLLLACRFVMGHRHLFGKSRANLWKSRWELKLWSDALVVACEIVEAS